MHSGWFFLNSKSKSVDYTQSSSASQQLTLKPSFEESGRNICRKKVPWVDSNQLSLDDSPNCNDTSWCTVVDFSWILSQKTWNICKVFQPYHCWLSNHLKLGLFWQIGGIFKEGKKCLERDSNLGDPPNMVNSLPQNPNVWDLNLLFLMWLYSDAT